MLQQKNDAGSALLCAQGVSAGYKDSSVIRDISLCVPEGGIVAVMGSNGVGKTTFLKTLMGLLAAKSGSITFKGRDITALSTEARAKSGIGYVPQGRFIFPYLTVEQNLTVGLDRNLAGSLGGNLAENFAGNFGGRARSIQHAADEMYDLLPQLRSLSKAYGGNLSGGQQQQLAIARVLIMRPSLLILDEPTEGIQPSIIQDISGVLRAARDRYGMSVLLVEQHVEFALEHASYYYVFSHGSAVQQGEVTRDNRARIMDAMSI